MTNLAIHCLSRILYQLFPSFPSAFVRLPWTCHYMSNSTYVSKKVEDAHLFGVFVNFLCLAIIIEIRLRSVRVLVPWIILDPLPIHSDLYLSSDSR